MASTPDYGQMLNSIWGWPGESVDLLPVISIAANICIGTNPPYSATDFFALYPKFGGTPLTPTATIDGVTNVLTNVSNISGIFPNQPVSGTGIADGSVIVSASGTTIVLSLPTTIAGVQVSLNVFSAPLIPIAILNAYIYLATSSVFQVRYNEMWSTAMGLFIAHYATLWLQAEASGPNSTAAQAAASGLAMGIKTSKSAGDVSVGLQPVNIEKFGAWNLTLYGQHFATIGAALGSAGMLIY